MLQSFCETSDFDPKVLLARLLNIRLTRLGDKTISGIEFLLACTNCERSYFELRMCRVSTLLGIVSGAGSFSVGPSDYDFILRNTIAILDSQITVDFREQFDTEWFELEVVPDITVPLTSRGERVMNYLWDNLDKYLSTALYRQYLGADAKTVATIISTAAQKKSDWLDKSDRMGMEPR